MTRAEEVAAMLRAGASYRAIQRALGVGPNFISDVRRTMTDDLRPMPEALQRADDAARFPPEPAWTTGRPPPMHRGMDGRYHGGCDACSAEWAYDDATEAPLLCPWCGHRQDVDVWLCHGCPARCTLQPGEAPECPECGATLWRIERGGGS